MMLALLIALSLVSPPDAPHSLPLDGWMDEDPVAHDLATRLDAPRAGAVVLRVGDATLHAPQRVTTFYQERDFRPAWSTPEDVLPQAEAMIALLRAAGDEGLDPSDYHAAPLAALVLRYETDAAMARRLAPTLRADLDLLLTDAFFRYGETLLHGRVRPSSVEPTWTAEPRQADLVRRLEHALLSGSVTASLQALAPSNVPYAALATTYRRYRRMAEAGGWPVVPWGPVLRPDATDPRVPLLRERLRITGDLPPADGPDLQTAVADVAPIFGDLLPLEAPDADQRYDARLVEGVRRFQARHGLTPDGVVGSATLAAMNVSATDRAQQLMLALERWRWMPYTPGRHVRVNVAAHHLQLLDDGREVLSMRVVTGRPTRATPVFSDQIRYLVLNPYWHVPLTLAVEDKVPAQIEDPSYFERQKIHVFTTDGEAVAATDVNWTTLSKTHLPYRLRQEPGPYNALGRVKFMFPNVHDVYLHDTPTRGDFQRDRRALSSGCVRLQEPMAMVEALLATQGWDAPRIDAAMSADVPRTVWLETPVPVHLFYWTAWADADGTAHFRPDIYEHDALLVDALSAHPLVIATR